MLQTVSEWHFSFLFLRSLVLPSRAMEKMNLSSCENYEGIILNFCACSKMEHGKHTLAYTINKYIYVRLLTDHFPNDSSLLRLPTNTKRKYSSDNIQLYIYIFFKRYFSFSH